jgi:6-phosphogluconolactonase
MRLLASLTLLATLGGAAKADTFVYVSIAGDKRIAIYQMDADGKLAHRGDAKTDGEPAGLVADPQRRFLFVAMRSTGNLSAFRIDAKSGQLTHVNTVAAGADPAHISTDAEGRFLFCAYYVANKVTVHTIGKDGALSKGPWQSLPTAEKAHAIVADPTSRFVFVPHTGSNFIYQFLLNAKTGELRPNPAASRVATPPKTGPRHLVFHPTFTIAYVDNEQGSSVTAYAVDKQAGTLQPLETVSTLPADFKEINACAEIKIHPSGKFLYVANRGHDSIARFAVDDAGKLAATGQTATEKTPRSFDLDPDGRFLFAAGESSGKLAAYRVDAKTGDLTRFAEHVVGPRPWWVLAVSASSGAPLGRERE